ncbi:hypothetical protein TRICI_000945 [Trichomonascus ciferrii]|uniref:F-box domain-containing protein n=1 Tax=Trichomonascus ciferrii TaxID=44093 RepID=A0A642VBN6_9ASCO|nr:hypothetical protein TRICI_000945 [Trichomonascus ciferrii]
MRVPREVLFKIISYLVPEGCIVSSSDVGVKTLLSFTLVCWATYSEATRYLFDRCVYIDSSARLEKLLDHNVDWDKVKSVYLAPFDNGVLELDVAKQVYQLFSSIPHVRQLVIDMPLRSLYPEEDVQGIRPILREAFEMLCSVEALTSVRDELYLDTAVDGWTVWSKWTNLRRLCLYNANVDVEFWSDVQKLKSLDTLVLVRPDGIFEVNDFAPPTLIERAFRIIHVDVHEEAIEIALLRSVLGESTPVESRIVQYEEDEITECQLWTKAKALNGSLWI